MKLLFCEYMHIDLNGLLLLGIIFYVIAVECVIINV